MFLCRWKSFLFMEILVRFHNMEHLSDIKCYRLQKTPVQSVLFQNDTHTFFSAFRFFKLMIIGRTQVTYLMITQPTFLTYGIATKSVFFLLNRLLLLNPFAWWNVRPWWISGFIPYLQWNMMESNHLIPFLIHNPIRENLLKTAQFLINTPLL